ncbi:MAG: hypothetical protein AAF518_13805 [Spirochaetota bacterium]
MIFALSPSLLQKHTELAKERIEYYPIYKELLQTQKNQVVDSFDAQNILQNTLASYFILTHSYQSFLYYGEEQIFSMGLDIIEESWLVEALHSLDSKQEEGESQEKHENFITLKEIEYSRQRFRVFSYSTFIGESSCTLAIVIPVDIIPNLYEIQPILKIVEQYYQYLPSRLVEDYPGVFADFISLLKKKVNDSFRRGESHGIISKFKLQNIKPYYGVMGEETTGIVLDYIKSSVKGRLKDDDLLLRPDQRTIITYSPNCDEQIIKKRFESLFFQYQYLIINYKVSYLNVESPIEDEMAFWQQLEEL